MTKRRPAEESALDMSDDEAAGGSFELFGSRKRTRQDVDDDNREEASHHHHHYHHHYHPGTPLAQPLTGSSAPLTPTLAIEGPSHTQSSTAKDTAAAAPRLLSHRPALSDLSGDVFAEYTIKMKRLARERLRIQQKAQEDARRIEKAMIDEGISVWKDWCASRVFPDGDEVTPTKMIEYVERTILPNENQQIMAGHGTGLEVFVRPLLYLWRDQVQNEKRASITKEGNTSTSVPSPARRSSMPAQIRLHPHESMNHAPLASAQPSLSRHTRISRSPSPEADFFSSAHSSSPEPEPASEAAVVAMVTKPSVTPVTSRISVSFQPTQSAPSSSVPGTTSQGPSLSSVTTIGTDYGLAPNREDRYRPPTAQQTQHLAQQQMQLQTLAKQTVAQIRETLLLQRQQQAMATQQQRQQSNTPLASPTLQPSQVTSIRPPATRAQVQQQSAALAAQQKQELLKQHSLQQAALSQQKAQDMVKQLTLQLSQQVAQQQAEQLSQQQVQDEARRERELRAQKQEAVKQLEASKKQVELLKVSKRWDEARYQQEMDREQQEAIQKQKAAQKQLDDLNDVARHQAATAESWVRHEEHLRQQRIQWEKAEQEQAENLQSEKDELLKLQEAQKLQQKQMAPQAQTRRQQQQPQTPETRQPRPARPAPAQPELVQPLPTQPLPASRATLKSIPQKLAQPQPSPARQLRQSVTPPQPTSDAASRRQSATSASLSNVAPVAPSSSAPSSAASSSTTAQTVSNASSVSSPVAPRNPRIPSTRSLNANSAQPVVEILARPSTVNRTPGAPAQLSISPAPIVSVEPSPKGPLPNGSVTSTPTTATTVTSTVVPTLTTATSMATATSTTLATSALPPVPVTSPTLASTAPTSPVAITSPIVRTQTPSPVNHTFTNAAAYLETLRAITEQLQPHRPLPRSVALAPPKQAETPPVTPDTARREALEKAAHAADQAAQNAVEAAVIAAEAKETAMANIVAERLRKEQELAKQEERRRKEQQVLEALEQNLQEQARGDEPEIDVEMGYEVDQEMEEDDLEWGTKARKKPTRPAWAASASSVKSTRSKSMSRTRGMTATQKTTTDTSAMTSLRPQRSTRGRKQNKNTTEDLPPVIIYSDDEDDMYSDSYENYHQHNEGHRLQQQQHKHATRSLDHAQPSSMSRVDRYSLGQGHGLSHNQVQYEMYQGQPQQPQPIVVSSMNTVLRAILTPQANTGTGSPSMVRLEDFDATKAVEKDPRAMTVDELWEEWTSTQSKRHRHAPSHRIWSKIQSAQRKAALGFEGEEGGLGRRSLSPAVTAAKNAIALSSTTAGTNGVIGKDDTAVSGSEGVHESVTTGDDAGAGAGTGGEHATSGDTLATSSPSTTLASVPANMTVNPSDLSLSDAGRSIAATTAAMEGEGGAEDVNEVPLKLYTGIMTMIQTIKRAVEKNTLAKQEAVEALEGIRQGESFEKALALMKKETDKVALNGRRQIGTRSVVASII